MGKYDRRAWKGKMNLRKRQEREIRGQNTYIRGSIPDYDNIDVKVQTSTHIYLFICFTRVLTCL